MRNRRRQRRRWLGSAVAASSLVCAPAHADDLTFGGGFFFGYRFAQTPGFELGFEAFATDVLNDDAAAMTGARHGIGPLLQVGLLGGKQPLPRFTLGLHLGSELGRDGFELGGELGVTYRGGPDDGFGLHTGLACGLSFVHAGLSYELGLEQGSIVGGARIMPTYWARNVSDPYRDAVPGRPLRTDDGLFQLSASTCMRDAATARRARDAVEPVGLAFERDAALEAASVPAFLQLASELAAAGAPRALVRRALRAAADEQAHARLTAQLAVRHLGRPAIVRVPEVALRRTLTPHASTVRLATESWLDGCCSEGSAAASVAVAAERAYESATRAVLAEIARDEQRHAELAWSILSWALQAGGEDARDAVHDAAAASTAETTVDNEHAPAAFEPQGRLAADTLGTVARAHARRSRARLHGAFGL
jgi:hypothetical protein